MHEREMVGGRGLDSQPSGERGELAGKTSRTQWLPSAAGRGEAAGAGSAGSAGPAVDAGALQFQPDLGLDLTGFSVPSHLAARVADVTGGDVSGVRLHTGEASAASAASLGARAYTLGQDVHFGAGEYQPGDREGDALIAHELVHTLQQRGSAAPSAQCKLEVSEPGDAAELEADVLAQRIIEPAAAPSGSRTAVTPVAATISRRISRVPIKVKIADTRPPEQRPQEQPKGDYVDPYPDEKDPGKPDAEADGAPPVQDEPQPKSKPAGDGIVDPWAAQHGEDQWGANVNPAYRGRKHKPAPEGSYVNNKVETKTVDSYRQSLKPLESISAKIKGPMREVTYDITTADIEYIVGPPLGAAAKGKESEFKQYVEHMVRAFSVCGIDTIEGQAVYLGHATGETGFAYPTEGQKKYLNDEKPGDAFQMDPHQAQILQDDAGPRRYMASHNWSIDPHNHIPKHDPDKPGRAKVDAATFQDTFIGRGPVQVTHHYNYVQTLVVMEELAKQANAADAQLLWEAVGAIKADPSQAANPKYTFLFSAAYMQMSGGADAAARLPGQKPNFYGQDDASSWVAGGGKDVRQYGEEFGKAADRKREAYNRALERLGEKAKAAADAEDAAAASSPPG